MDNEHFLVCRYNQTFVSEILQQNGYQTAVVGKWHMRCEPKGFDYYQILFDQGAYYNPEFKSKETGGKYIRREGYATTLTTDYAINFWSIEIILNLSVYLFITKRHIEIGCRNLNI